MATVEVDETDLLRYQKLAQVATALNHHPQAKLLLQQATKTVFPTANTPELDAVKATYSKEVELNQRLSNFERAQAERDAQREAAEKSRQFVEQHEGGFKDLRQQGYTEAGVAEIRKIMEDKGILDHKIAAAYFDKQHPPQELTTPRHGPWNFAEGIADDEADLKKLIESKGNNEFLVDKMAREALAEARGFAIPKRA